MIFVIISIISSFKSVHAMDKNDIELGIGQIGLGYQSDVISSFFDKKIPFYIDHEGLIKYPAAYENIANETVEKLNARPIVEFSDIAIGSLFIMALKHNNIPFLIRESIGKNKMAVVYNLTDYDKVQKTVMPIFKKSLINGRKTGVYKIQQ